MATGPQLTKLAILRFESKRSRAEWFDWIEAEIGRRVTSNRELTMREASHLIEINQAQQEARS